MSEPISIDDLTFGVELEVILPAGRNGTVGRIALAEALTAAGLSAAHEEYNHRTRPHWKIVTDGSIGNDNAEVVSPILTGDNGFIRLRAAANAIQAFGCRVNRTTGLHVHVGARQRFDNNVGFFKELLRLYEKFEPVLDTIVAPSRRADNNTYCGPVRLAPSAAQATTIQGLLDRHRNRFVKLNLQSYSTHGTVEFRQHQGTTNAEKIEAWVRLCLRMVSHASQAYEPVAHSQRPPQTAVAADPFQPTYYHTPETGRTFYRRGDICILMYTTSDINFRSAERARLHYNGLVEEAEHLGIGGFYASGAYRRPRTRASAFSGDTAANMILGLQTELMRRARPQAEATADRALADRITMEATSPPPPPTSGPLPTTLAAPSTLEGLLDLLQAPEAERAYFIERQLELNP